MVEDHVKKTIAVYDLIAIEYANKLDDYAPRQEQERFVSLLPQGATILDAGCGPGRDSDFFDKKGLRVVGIDLSEKLLEIARNRVPKAVFHNQDLRNLNFPDQSFNGIWACASLHHLNRGDMLRVLDKFFELLKPNGVLFILVKEGSGEEDVAESLSSGLPRHYVYYSLEELRDLQEKAGFKVGEIYAWREEERRPGRSNLVWISSFSRKS